MSTEKTKYFYRDDVTDALRACRRGHYQPEFAPELIERRTNADKKDSLWQNWWTTLSLKATGRTSAGTPIILYAHVPHYFCQPKNITKAIDEGLINGAGILPEGELSRLESGKAGGRVFVLDYASAIKWPSGYYGLEDPTEEHVKLYGGKMDGKEMLAINHPLLAPLMGNKKKVAPYLEKLAQVYGKDKVYIGNFNDWGERDVGRLLVLGYGHGLNLFGNGDLNDGARFLGVRRSGAPAGRKAEKFPSLEEMCDTLGKEVKGPARVAAEGRIRNLYDRYKLLK